MLLSKLLEGCCASGTFADADITNVVSDSRKVTPGSMFIALRGDSDDGNAHVKEALQRGAVSIVTDGDIRCDGVVRVADAYRAEALIYSNYYARPAKDLRIVAVTGTNGKTSTVSAVSHILRSAGETVGVIGSVELSAGGEALDRDKFLSPEKSAGRSSWRRRLMRCRENGSRR